MEVYGVYHPRPPVIAPRVYQDKNSVSCVGPHSGFSVEVAVGEL